MKKFWHMILCACGKHQKILTHTNGVTCYWCGIHFYTSKKEEQDAEFEIEQEFDGFGS